MLAGIGNDWKPRSYTSVLACCGSAALLALSAVAPATDILVAASAFAPVLKSGAVPYFFLSFAQSSCSRPANFRTISALHDDYISHNKTRIRADNGCVKCQCTTHMFWSFSGLYAA